MNNYILFANSEGRVILGAPNLVKKEDEVLREVSAKSWLDAREKCEKYEGALIVRNEGHGWLKR